MGCDTDKEHRMKITNVTTSKVRVKVTVSGKRWLQDEENRDGWELVQEGK